METKNKCENPNCTNYANAGYKLCFSCGRNGVSSSSTMNDEILKQLKFMNNNLGYIRAAVCKDKALLERLKKAPSVD